MTEAIEFLPIGTQGAHALSVSNSSRLWREFHERYCITVVSAGHSCWRYRGAHMTASPSRLMLMEPGEVHVTTSVEQAGTFMALCFSEGHLTELSRDISTRPIHFSKASLFSPESVRRLTVLAQRRAFAEPAEQEEALCLSVSQIVREAAEAATPVPARARTHARRGAKLLRELYMDSPWKTVDIRFAARTLGISYHWFVHSFKDAFGLPPYQYVRALRRAQARRLFAQGPRGSVKTLLDVAHAVGYADAPHLSRDCRQTWGVAPSRMAPAMHCGWS